MRTNLRLWSIVDVVYAVGVTSAVLVLVPWKRPEINALLVVYALMVGGSGAALWRPRKWSFWWAALTSLFGLGLAIVVVTGFVAAWAFLRGVYGSFGLGASIVSLILASTAFQVLGLHAALRLRALLRDEVRSQFTHSKALVWSVWCLLSLPLLTGGFIQARFGLSPLAPLRGDQANRAVAFVRARLDGKQTSPSGLSDVPAGVSAVAVKLFARGRVVAQAFGDGRDLGVALEAATQALTPLPHAVRASEVTVAIERAVAVGPIPAWPGFVAGLAFDPGRDTVRIAGSGTEGMIPTDELIRRDVYGAGAPLSFLPEIRLGVDPSWIRSRLSAPASAPLERVRVESWVECGATADGTDAPQGACALLRGNTPLRELDLEASAAAAARYMLARQHPDGAFDYIYLPYTDQTDLSQAYSVARHAGTAYSLATLYGLLKQPEIKQGCERALGFLLQRLWTPCGRTPAQACLVDYGARVGPNALLAIALLEYRRTTGSHRYDRWIHRVISFLQNMQRPNGDFYAVFDPRTDRANTAAPPVPFAAEEAALALVLAGRELEDPDAWNAAERALDFLTGSRSGDKYGHFLGQFTYGVDTWTCMAANAAWPHLKARRYLDFCLGYADFMRRLQYRQGDAPSPDYFGLYGFSHVLMPQAGGAGGAAEAMAAILELARHHEESAPAVEAQLQAVLTALARDQIRPDNDLLVMNPRAARGGIRRSLLESEIRIDFVQHAASAFAHGARLNL